MAATRTIGTWTATLDAWRGKRTSARRARNLRAGARRAAARGTLPALPALRWPRPGVPFWIGAGGALAIVVGAALIVAHARSLALAAGPVGAVNGEYAAGAFQAVVPGAAFSVPEAPGVALDQHGKGALLIATQMQGAAPVRVDLCSQIADPASGRLLPLHVGYPFGAVAGWVARGEASGATLALRNVLLGAPGAAMPRIDIGGVASADFAQPLQLRWEGRAARWIGDAGDGRIVEGVAASVPLRREGWLVWGGDAALRIVRRASAACAAGELHVQLFRPGARGGRAQVVAFGSHGTQSAWLPPGRYAVPAAAAPDLEDQTLFAQLQAHGLVRLGASGLVELAPRDLRAWRAAPAGERAALLAAWADTPLDPVAVKLIEHLYHRADGDFVRAQAAIFNSERRLLAWRMQPAAPAGTWQASVAGAAVPLAQSMPAAAARLFAELPQGWSGWNRIAAWPGDAGASGAQLTYALTRAAAGGEAIALMVAGRVTALAGARLAQPAQDACTGRACPDAGAVRVLPLVLLPGARQVRIDLAPLDAGKFAAPGDAQYRHLRVSDGKLAWQAIDAGKAAGTAALAPVTLGDRHGVPLWSDGAPTAAATAAGLAPLLGYRAEQANSVAGMLARLPAGAQHDARLTLDLALQAASQGALDCLGMRRGRWDGASCSGGAAPPAGRHAGMVVIDTETGDVLAAAGAGVGQVDGANWREVRDFDRMDPARSPLRLPAWQHDGGAHQSPGSTFKVVSALGLELAAQRDPQLDALLGGMPLAAINTMARTRGFAFQTDAPSYPWGAQGARITNYREQQLDRRAQDGRLGMAQALTYSLNTWFAWAGELSDASLFGKAVGGAPGVQALEPAALARVRPIVDMAQRLGFEQAVRLDGGLLPADFAWNPWDALQSTPAHIDPVHARHELRQLAIGLRMQATPLQMALAAGAVGQGRTVAPRLLLALDGRAAAAGEGAPLGVRLDRIRAGMKGVVDVGTGAAAFRGASFDGMRRGLFGKTGTSPTGPLAGADGAPSRATVWFTAYLEPGSIPGQAHRLALAAFVSHSEASGGEHAAPIVAAVLASMARNVEQKGK